LLLGEDMSGCGNGVPTALAISNAITNLCGMKNVFLFGFCSLLSVCLVLLCQHLFSVENELNVKSGLNNEFEAKNQL